MACVYKGDLPLLIAPHLSVSFVLALIVLDLPYDEYSYIPSACLTLVALQTDVQSGAIGHVQ